MQHRQTRENCKSTARKSKKKTDGGVSQVNCKSSYMSLVLPAISMGPRTSSRAHRDQPWTPPCGRTEALKLFAFELVALQTHRQQANYAINQNRSWRRPDQIWGANDVPLNRTNFLDFLLRLYNMIESRYDGWTIRKVFFFVHFFPFARFM